ncbi:hypothetical protein Pint_26953 [Pistacia integerrima]|uniref:Uncharacterized protein n=1 Tax=Pistacia integerrima TaxID=434235 RepID=A0ACC0YTX2_9ROSI|nr:hypothetical protein Pint_26953 [Pistacia integerrima]
MSFGLCNAPSTFQAIMNSVFRTYLCKFVLVFFYDILIYSLSWNMHLEHIKKAFKILRHHQFFIKMSKFAFGQQELEYLGHIITPHVIKVDQTKIEAMINWPRLINISELRGFLDLIGYYRKFVRNYGILARPLTNLLKRGQFGWPKEAEQTFTNLKQAMKSTPILAMPKFTKPFVIESDASDVGIGAVLTQQGKPITFMSRALGMSKKSWSTYAKEMLAIVHSPSLDALFMSQVEIWEEIKKAAVGQAYMERIGKLAMDNPGAPYSWRNELVLYKNRVDVPPNSRIIPQLLREFHDSYFGGHSGVLSTYKRLA